MIVRVGERVSSEQAKKLEMIFRASTGGTPYTALGIFGLVVVLFYFPYRFACKNIRKFNPSNRDLFAIGIMIVSSFTIFKLALLVSANIGAAFPGVPPSSYYYLFLFAAGAMVVRVLLNSEIALVYCVMMAPLLGILFNSNMLVVVYAMLGSVVGAHGVRCRCDRSSDYTAGSKVAVVNLAMGLCFPDHGRLALFNSDPVCTALPLSVHCCLPACWFLHSFPCLNHCSTTQPISSCLNWPILTHHCYVT